MIGKRDLELESAIRALRHASRPSAEPALDLGLPDVARERGGIVARGLAGSPEQPVVWIGARPRHAAEHRRLLDDDGGEPVIAEPQRPGNAGRPAADDRHIGHFRYWRF